MKRTWLLFSQAVTVLLAGYFVVATLKPEWLGRRSGSLGGVVSVLEAPPPRSARGAAGSLSGAAKKAAPAVVSINTSKAASRDPRSDDPWFRFFFGDQGQATPGRTGQRRDRQRGRLHPDQQPCGRRRRRDRSHPQRQPPGARPR